MVINFECGQTFVHDSVDEGQQTGTAKDPKIYVSRMMYIGCIKK